MATAAIRSTVTQKVRRFLASQGVATRPWTNLDDVYGALYELLNRRRDDPAFWPPLARLLEDVVADLTDPASPKRLAAPQAELLRSWDLRRLVQDLRAALPGGRQPGDPRTVRRFGASLSAQLLGGFLLLGLAAAGCKLDEHDITPDIGDSGAQDATDGAPDEASPPTDDAGGLCPDAGEPAWAAECSLEPSTVLWCTLATSSQAETSKASLCTCFASLNDGWRNGLAALFATEDSATVAQALSEMLYCVCNEPALLSGAYQDPTAGPYGGSLCEPAPAYKGVSFPDR